MQLRHVATLLTAAICWLGVTLSTKDGECALAICKTLTSIPLM